MKKTMLTTEKELMLRFSFRRVVMNLPPLEESFGFFRTIRDYAGVSALMGIVADPVVDAYRPKRGVTLYGSIADPATGELYVWILPPAVNDRVAPRVAFETARTLREWNGDLMAAEGGSFATAYERDRLMERNRLLQDFLKQQEDLRRSPSPLF